MFSKKTVLTSEPLYLLHNKKAILGNVVKLAREKKGLTQAQLAEKVGVGTRTILDIENGRGNPRFHILTDIIHELNIPANSIFRPKSTPTEKSVNRLLLEINTCSEKEKRIVIDSALNLINNLKSVKIAD